MPVPDAPGSKPSTFSPNNSCRGWPNKLSAWALTERSAISLRYHNGLRGGFEKGRKRPSAPATFARARATHTYLDSVLPGIESPISRPPAGGVCVYVTLRTDTGGENQSSPREGLPTEEPKFRMHSVRKTGFPSIGPPTADRAEPFSGIPTSRDLSLEMFGTTRRISKLTPSAVPSLVARGLRDKNSALS